MSGCFHSFTILAEQKHLYIKLVEYFFVFNLSASKGISVN